MKKWFDFFIIAITIFSLLTLSGCSGGESAETTGEPAGQEDDPSSEEIVVASDTAFAPFAFQDANTGEYVGFDMDIIRAVSEVNGWSIKIRSMNYDDIIPALEEGSIDMAISAITITREYKEKVAFSQPYFRTDQSVAIKVDGEEINSVEDLAGKRLGVQVSTTGAMEAGKIPYARLIEYNTIEEAFMALKNGELDAVITDFPVNAYFIKQGNEDIKIAAVLNTNEYYGIAVGKDRPEILRDVNSALEFLKENNKYAEIYKEWFNEEPPEYLPGEPPLR